MTKRGRKRTTVKIKRHDIEPFECEVYKSAEDLDWALRMYYITLMEHGFTEELATKKMQNVFAEALRRAKEKHA